MNGDRPVVKYGTVMSLRDPELRVSGVRMSSVRPA